VDFLLVLIELFALGVTVLQLSHYTSEKRDRKSAISLQRGHFDPKFLVQGVASDQLFFAWIVRPMNVLQLYR